MKKYLLSVAVLTASGAAVHAGGPVVVAAEPTLAPMAQVMHLQTGEWHGGYVGGNLNWGKNPISGFLDDPSGASGALRGGYDWQMGATVVGLGAEYDFGRLRGSDAAGAASSVGKAATVFGRAGYATGAWLPYVMAGYTWADGNAGGTNVDLTGYTIGLGVERKFTDRWSGYVEYNRSDFGREVAFGDARVRADKVKLGVNFRF
ncbi:MAG: porin family protein [Gemmobacter sp.]|nr:porin family protein [Gemmobacter sp.]